MNRKQRVGSVARLTLGATMMVLLMVPALGCGDDAPGGAGDGGESTVQVTGDVEGSFSGHAVFTQATLDLGIFGVGLTDNSTYDVDLNIDVPDGTPPAPNVYSVGGIPSEDHFTAIFRDISAGFAETVEYTAWDEQSGTVEITASSMDEVEGQFQFVAQRDLEGGPTVDVSGSFRAVRVAGGGR